MTPFCTLTSGIKSAIPSLLPAQSAGVNIVIEDDQDIDFEIARAQQELGMLVLIGIPDFHNEDALADLVNAKIQIEMLVREVPALWRVSTNDNPIHCADLGQALGAKLQALFIPGFQPLRVIVGMPMGKVYGKDSLNNPTVFQDYKLILETMQIFNLSTGS